MHLYEARSVTPLPLMACCYGLEVCLAWRGAVLGPGAFVCCSPLPPFLGPVLSVRSSGISLPRKPGVSVESSAHPVSECHSPHPEPLLCSISSKNFHMQISYSFYLLIMFIIYGVSALLVCPFQKGRDLGLFRGMSFPKR